MQPKSLLLLEYDQALIPEGGSQVTGTLTCLTVSYKKEPAGHIYHHQALRQAGVYDELYPDEDDETDDASVSDTNGPSSTFGSQADFSSMNEEDPNSTKWKGKGKKKDKVKRQGQGYDLYALLGLQHERWMATQEQIRLAYRKAALEFHPDKQRAYFAEKGDEEGMLLAEERFKAIQEAYETLTDLQKRREFDSVDDFDNSLPSDCKDGDFLRVFGAAFKRNARWSIPQPVPDLGDENSTEEYVHEFYEFWYKFKSWREFPHPDEEDVEQAETREHRRYIERFNSKLREKGKKEDVRRIREFVDNAYRLDPRIIAWKEAQKAERENKRLEKEREKEAKRLAEEELLQKEREEEAARKAIEDAAAAEARKQRQFEKKALQKERSRLRKLTLTETGACSIKPITGDDIEDLCSTLDLVSLNALSDQITAATSDSDKATALYKYMGSVAEAAALERQRKEEALKEIANAAKLQQKLEAKERLAKLQEWSDEEVRLLNKALDKFPPGTAKRWEVVQSYVRTRTVDEVVEMVKHGLKSGRFSRSDAEGLTIVAKRQGNTTIKDEATKREESFSDVDVNLRGEAAVVLGAASTPAAAAAPAPAVPVVEATPAPTPVNATAPARASSGEESEWTQAEDAVLVKALKDVPKEAADRWEQVAAKVGRSKVQCAKRFKDMKSSYKAKKTTV